MFKVLIVFSSLILTGYLANAVGQTGIAYLFVVLGFLYIVADIIDE